MFFSANHCDWKWKEKEIVATTNGYVTTQFTTTEFPTTVESTTPKSTTLKSTTPRTTLPESTAVPPASSTIIENETEYYTESTRPKGDYLLHQRRSHFTGQGLIFFYYKNRHFFK